MKRAAVIPGRGRDSARGEELGPNPIGSGACLERSPVGFGADGSYLAIQTVTHTA